MLYKKICSCEGCSVNAELVKFKEIFEKHFLLFTLAGLYFSICVVLQDSSVTLFFMKTNISLKALNQKNMEGEECFHSINIKYKFV